MSKSDKKPIENAAEVIERFGGIRPMSSKTNVPVTTIQGWKKRNVIPASRREGLLEVANENNIDLSDLLGETPAPDIELAAVDESASQESDDNGNEQEPADDTEKPVPEFVKPEEEEAEGEAENIDEEGSSGDASDDLVAARNDESASAAAPKTHIQDTDGFTELAMETEKKAVTKSALISFLLLLLGIGLLVALLWPKVEKVDEQGNRLSALEGDLSSVKKQQATFKGLVSEDWSEQLEELKAQVSQAKQSVGSTVENVQAASSEILGEHAGTLEDRLMKLESYVQELTESNAVAGVLARIQMMRETGLGQQTLESASQELSALMESMGDDREGLNGVLDSARHRSDALAKTFQDVPQKDMKAAAMLLALTQMRESLNRDSTPFSSDLGLLMNMVGNEDPELRAALERLAPFAEQGVLTPQGLSDEFRSLAGDVVVSSLQGEDVSISEKAKARMNNLFQVEKDGELITGTETQATVNRAQNHLDQGDIAGTLEVLETLAPEELDALGPWMEKARAAMTAGTVQKIIKQSIEMTAGSGYLGGAQLLSGESGLEVNKR